VDVSRPPTTTKIPAHANAIEILVLNKIDLGLDPAWTDEHRWPSVQVSCLTGEGIESLADAICARVTGGQLAWNPATAAINARHQRCLARARGSLIAARDALATGTSPEFVALDLRAALDAVGEVVGGTDTEEILGKIFSTFCIGK
jgi:tRNA modification GTPase